MLFLLVTLSVIPDYIYILTTNVSLHYTVITVLVNGWLLSNDQQEIVSYIMAKTIYIRWDANDVRFVLNKHA